MGLYERAINAYNESLEEDKNARYKMLENSKEEFKAIFGEYPDDITDGHLNLDGFKFSVNRSLKLVPYGVEEKDLYDFIWVQECKKCRVNNNIGKVKSLKYFGELLRFYGKDTCKTCGGEIK